MIGMSTKTRAISIEESDIPVIEQAARDAGLSFSAFMARAAKREVRRTNGKKFRQVMNDLHPEDRALLDQLQRDRLELWSKGADA